MSASEPLSLATTFSLGLLTQLVARGVHHLVVSPGSRSQALALAAAELERAGHITLHVVIDERAAGFLALGIARETGMPAAVITTSGTAVANLHPAVLEAWHADVPLIVLTADRPAELIGIRANQATHQPAIFTPHTATLQLDEPGELDASAVAKLTLDTALGTTAELAHPDRHGVPGPVHVNIALRAPLSSEMPALADAPLVIEPSTAALVALEAAWAGRDALARTAPVHPVDEIALEVDGRLTVVVAGADAGDGARELAEAAGWPLIAEISSGARSGPNAIAAYRELISGSERAMFGDLIERVIVFGHPTLSREVPELASRPEVSVVVVTPDRGEAFSPGRRFDDASVTFAKRVSLTGEARPLDEGDRHDHEVWLANWQAVSRRLSRTAEPDAPSLEDARATTTGQRARFLRDELAVAREAVTREMLVLAVWRATWPYDRLVIGASRLIRELDRRAPGRPVRAIANRGLAGIDGTVALASGVARAAEHSAVAATTRVLIGDITLLHDAGSLLLAAQSPRLQLIVGNDRGGTIFESLEVRESADPAAFERVVITPHEVDLGALAAAYGLGYERVATRAELERALSVAPSTATLIEAVLTE